MNKNTKYSSESVSIGKMRIECKPIKYFEFRNHKSFSSENLFLVYVKTIEFDTATQATLTFWAFLKPLSYYVSASLFSNFSERIKKGRSVVNSI